MKLMLGFAFVGMVAFAESFTGTVVDVACKGKDLAAHTRQCAMKCGKSGYGLVTSDGKFMKFDEVGNTKVAEALKASSKEADLKATVTGKVDGDLLVVESIALD